MSPDHWVRALRLAALSLDGAGRLVVRSILPPDDPSAQPRIVFSHSRRAPPPPPRD